jgi:Ca2+/Na+ antiporter
VSDSNTSTRPDRVDVRGPRFAAWVTTAVLLITLLVSAVSPLAAAVILGLQAVVFAIGALGGPRRHPYGRVFATVLAPRLGPVKEREPVPPLKFAQLVGLVFAVVGVAGFASGASLVGVIATAAALVAAFLNAAFGICLGCQLYPLVARFRPTAPPAHPV